MLSPLVVKLDESWRLKNHQDDLWLPSVLLLLHSKLMELGLEGQWRVIHPSRRDSQTSTLTLRIVLSLTVPSSLPKDLELPLSLLWNLLKSLSILRLWNEFLLPCLSSRHWLINKSVSYELWMISWLVSAEFSGEVSNISVLFGDVSDQLFPIGERKQA